MKLEREVDRLYSLPRAEFIGARNELVKVLRGRGERQAADEIRALTKPSVAAWAVNRLYRTDRRRFDRLLAAGKQLRRALGRGTTSRAAEERKREALTGLLRRAERLLEEAGSKWTPALRQRVHRTLESLAAAPPGSSPRPGRLTEDLQPSGFDALAGATIAPGRPGARKPTRKRPSPAAERRRKAHEERVRILEGDLGELRRKRASAARALTRADRRAAEARKKSLAAQRRAEEARERADELDLRRRQAKAAHDQASSAVARVEARLQTEKNSRRGG